MMLTKGMTAEQVEEMVEVAGWEVLEEEEYEAFDGSVAVSMVVFQGDHAVAFDLFHGLVDDLQYVPEWEL